MSNVKILQLDRYASFRNGFLLFLSNRKKARLKLTDEQLLKSEKDRLKEEGSQYDGPLRYLEEVPKRLSFLHPWPAKQEIKYCVRLSKKEKEDFFSTDEGKNELRRGCNKEDWYYCYTYQLGRWWTFSKPQYLYSDIYLPLIDRETHRKLSKSGAFKFLDKKYQKSMKWWWQYISCEHVRRGVIKWRVSALKKKK